jgi:hypothetical protein
MDKAAEKLSEWFGSAPFILFHVVWFAGWVGAHYLLKFDSDWNLRAENVQSSRQEKFIKKDLKKSDKVLEKLG